MSFLTPLFLLGLSALAIPVLLHLVQRERKRVVEFPSLMFVSRVPYKSVRRRRIRHWALLAMRLLALALLVLAFGRPFLRTSGTVATAAAGPRELIVLLDRSYSMGYGSRWADAQSAASDAFQGMAAGERGTLIVFDTGATAVVRSSLDSAQLTRAVADAQPGSYATRFGPALKLAESVLISSALPRREVVIVSDFQRNGWNADDSVRMPQGTVMTPVVIGKGQEPNVSVTAVSLQRMPFSGRERVAVTAALANRSSEAVGAVSVTLESGGQVVSSQRVDIEPNASASAIFPPLTIDAETMRLRVGIPNDGLAADNGFHVVLSPQRSLPVALIESRVGAEGSLYLTHALGIGNTPRFELRRHGQSAWDRSSLPARGAAVLNDVPLAELQRGDLPAWVEAGGGVLIVAGNRTEGQVRIGPAQLATMAALVDRPPTTAGILANIDFSHEIFEPFKAPRSGDFASARFFRYRPVTIQADGRVIVRFDDGAPALVEWKVGRGRVLLWTSTLDALWNDLALKPVFLPFVHRALRYLAQYREAPAWHTAGQIVDAAVLPPEMPASLANVTIVTPTGERYRPSERGATAVELSNQGFYELTANNRTLAIAANLDPAEGDLTAMDPQELLAASAGRSVATAAAPPVLSPQDQERRSGLGWYLLVAALALLAAETFFANRVARSTTATDLA
ncbi:MAG: BatA domain-containing protein [Vicinamibacterales bacterium]